MEIVTFVPEPALRSRMEEVFALREAQLGQWLPFAEIEHIGSTAIPGTLTKGDLDVLIRVSAENFRLAEEVLSGLFPRNEGTPRTDSFASFKDGSANPPLGIQLVVRGSEWDVFSQFRDSLKADPSLVRDYNELKKAHHGRDMDEYRAAKERFVERVLNRTSCGLK